MNHTYGIEIEVIRASAVNIRTALIEVGLSEWKIVGDASLSVMGLEVVSPILSGDQGLLDIRKAVEAIRSTGAKVDTSCGVHVHFGARDFTAAQMVKVAKHFARYEVAFDQIVAPSRRGMENNYTKSSLAPYVRGVLGAHYHENYRDLKPTPAQLVQAEANFFRDLDACKTVQEVHAVMNACNNPMTCSRDHYAHCRYFKMNLHAYGRQGTIEFRQHQGSLNATKLVNWVRLLDAFLTYSKAGVIRAPKKVYSPAKTLHRLCDQIGVLEDLYFDYFKARAKSLAKDGEPETPQSPVASRR